jgi:hypothetical protein
MRPITLTSTIVSLVNGISCLPSTYDINSGCNKALPTGVDPDASVNLTLSSSSGVTPRKYRLHLPKGYDGSKALPLILSFHGRGQDALYQENLSQFSNASYGFEGIAVYPEGVPIVVVRIETSQMREVLIQSERRTHSAMAGRPGRTIVYQRCPVHTRTD